MDSGKSDNAQFIGYLILAVILLAIYLFVWFPQIRGPATDMTITIKIDPNGNISKYSAEIQFEDTPSYVQFLNDLKSPTSKTMKDYLLRDISSPELFRITNDSTNNKITIVSSTPFDPNQIFSYVRITKSQNYWEFKDSSIINSSYIPEKYVNKLTYSLTIPSKIIYANTIDNSSSFFFPNEKTLKWTNDKNKNPLNPVGNNIGSPEIYVKFEIPEPTDYTRIIILGIAALIVIVVSIGYLRRY